MLKVDVASVVEAGKLKAESLVGKSLRRVEDLRNLTGRTTFVDDIYLPRMAYMGVVRSSYAHALIKKLDLSNLAANPRVLGWVTSEEVRALMDPLPLLFAPNGTRNRDIYPTALDKVRYVGEPIAASLRRQVRH
jgi:carbon-monoxide dehydrogenase large subunit